MLSQTTVYLHRKVIFCLYNELKSALSFNSYEYVKRRS